MSDRLSHIEARLGEIEQALADVRRRIDALDVVRPGIPPSASEAPSPPLSAGRPNVSGVVSLIGRTFVVLGGAYLLRALTESGRLPGRGGVILGLAYAIAWFGAADRASVTRPLSGLFHGLAAVVISLPLLWEASVYFKLLTPTASAATLALITGLALAVAWHRHLQSLAGVAVIGSIAAAAALVLATARPLPFAAGILALGPATLWLSDARGWSWLRWPPALAADVMAVALIARSAGVPAWESHGAVIALLLILLAAYVGWVAWHTMVDRRIVEAGEMIQATCAVAIGLPGALAVASGGPSLVSTTLGGLSLLAGAAGYAAAFGILKGRAGPRASFVFFTFLAIALVMIGGVAILSGPARLAWCGGLTLVAAALGARTSEPQLTLHAAVLSVAMAGASGLLSWMAIVWFTNGPWAPLNAAHVATIVVAAACLAIPPRAIAACGARPPLLFSASRLIVAVVLAAGSSAMLMSWLGPIVAGDPADVGVLASIGTAVLAGSVLVIAALSRITWCVEFGWLLYPVLVAGGLKLVVGDVRHSTSATLFAALAMYGVALILAPRIARRA